MNVEAAAQCLYDHRAVGGEFDCACGWMGNGFAHAHRLHVIAALTSPRRETCPTCGGAGGSPEAMPRDERDEWVPCIECLGRGTVPADPYLRWADETTSEAEVERLREGWTQSDEAFDYFLEDVAMLADDWDEDLTPETVLEYVRTLIGSAPGTDEYRELGGGFHFIQDDARPRVLGEVMMAGWQDPSDVPVFVRRPQEVTDER